MKNIFNWLVKFICKKSVLKTIGALVVIALLASLGLYNLGANAIGKSPVHPDDLQQIDECQLKILRYEKGLVTYNSLKEATLKCNEKEKMDLEYQQMIIQKKIIDERLNEMSRNTEEEKEKNIKKPLGS